VSLNLDRSIWKRVKLGDVVVRSRTQADPLDGEVDRYVAGGHIDTHSVIIRRSGDVTDGQMGSTFHYLFEPGQVLFVSARPYLRKTGVPDFGGVVADKTYVLEAAPDNGLLNDMLPFLLTSDRFVEYANQEATGSMNPRLLWGAMQRYEFDLPPLDEQKRIADLLWALEQHKQSIASDAIERVEDIYLESLLAESMGKLMQISSIGSVLMGRQRSPIHATGDHMISYLRVANVGDDKLRLEDVKQMNFTPEEQERYDIRSGDILLSEGQSRELVGQSVLISDLPEPMCFQNTLVRFRANPSIVRPEYAQALFRACLRAGIFASIAARTTSIAHLGVQRFAQLRVRVPSLHEQNRVIAELAHIQAARESVKAELRALVTLSSQISRRIFGASE
jgi:type I restriction enzyme, S subunit